MFLEVKNIHKRFGNTEVLKGVGFSMEKGEVLSIIGSSGSGKTTLLRCLNFLETADEGSISVDGVEVFCAGKTMTDSEKRKNRLHFGLVFQSFNLFPQYSVIENIVLAPDILAKERISAEKLGSHEKKHFLAEAKKEHLEEARVLLDKVGLSDKADFYPHQLSGGQSQRVAIARALAMHPEILCFDEPTSALDPELTGEVLNVIRSLKSKDTTMIVVTHEMGFAKGVSDSVIFMADGLVEEHGSPEQVFSNPLSEKTKAFLNHSLENVVSQ